MPDTVEFLSLDFEFGATFIGVDTFVLEDVTFLVIGVTL